MTIRSSLPSFALALLVSQTPLAGQTAISIAGGLTMSKVAISETGFDLVPDGRTGITAGVSVSRQVSGLVALQIGGAYVQKGYKVSLEFLGERVSSTLKLGYVELTALAKPSFSLEEFMGERSSFHLLVGPALGIGMSCSAKFDLAGQSETEDCADDLNTMDLGVLGGVGIQMGRFRVDATYTLGFMSIDSGLEEEGGDGPDSVKNRSVAIQAGFVIPLGGSH